ncbi:hypothetical protein [Pseudochrobactrum asaccharolyticum]|uniref:Secreted protein n=1 Tax=Pseudochrobactrum asaccharolyticum TaxID=354351 RepID=A0A366DHF1_9HYPH|nr:hypothetical protein [Pseudochrobactrum asaccharolyticum]RBO88764.1 hypothetical protein DFR47_1185 [Pseudochrobactrum asaccharolyticum]
MLKLKSFLLSLTMSMALISHANAQTLEPTPPGGMPEKHKSIVQKIGRALSYQKTCVISKISEGYTAEVTLYMNNNRDGFEWSFINPGGKYNAYLNEYSRYETERIMDEYVEHYNLNYAKLVTNFTDDQKKSRDDISDLRWHTRMQSCYRAVVDFGEAGSLWPRLMDISCTSFRPPYCSDENKFEEWVNTQSYVCDDNSIIPGRTEKDKEKFACHKMKENSCTLRRIRGSINTMASLGSGC